MESSIYEEEEMQDLYKSPSQNMNFKVTTYSTTQTDSATHLCIHSPASKLTSDSESEYSIGGTYREEEEEFWFFGVTSLCHGDNHLFKLYVIPRKDVRFSLFLPNIGHNLEDKLKVNKQKKKVTIIGAIKEFRYASAKKDEVIFVKAFRFTTEEIDKLGEMFLLLPCKIMIYSSYRIHSDIINNIKLEYTVQINEALYKTKHEGDFILESVTGKRYPIHLFVAAAQSSVLRDVIKNELKSYMLTLSDKDVEMLVVFLYKGTVNSLTTENAFKLLDIADTLKLPGMKILAETQLCDSINEENAISIATLAKKYDAKILSAKVYDFIKSHPKILLSRSINQLNDIDLMRAILQYLGNSC